MATESAARRSVYRPLRAGDPTERCLRVRRTVDWSRWATSFADLSAETDCYSAPAHRDHAPNRRSAATASRSVGRSIRAQTLRSDAEPGEGDGWVDWSGLATLLSSQRDDRRRHRCPSVILVEPAHPISMLSDHRRFHHIAQGHADGEIVRVIADSDIRRAILDPDCGPTH